jgi:hypothetical protein
MPRPSFTVEQAKAAGKRSAELRAQRKLNPPIAQPVAMPEALSDAGQTLSAYAYELARAQSELLAELRSCDSAKDKAALSQAIKNLREAWHMETGAPKPGTIKPESRRTRQSPARPPEPEPIDPSIPQ